VKLVEAAVQTLVGIMRTSLPDKLQAIDVEMADGIICTPPKRYIDFEPTQDEIPDRPLLSVLAGNTKFLADTGYGGGGWADAKHEVAVVAVLEHPDTRTLAKQLLRYQRAIIEVAGANRVGVIDPQGAVAWNGLSVQGTILGERFVPKGNPNVYGDLVIVILEVNRTEA
jgi:hypothetical protein